MFLAREQIEQAFERLNEQLALEGERADVFLVGGWRSLSHLTVSHADAPTLLAMKCAASRSEEDARDIQFLATHLGLTMAEEVLAVVVRYYPEDRLPVRTRLLVQEMFP